MWSIRRNLDQVKFGLQLLVTKDTTSTASKFGRSSRVIDGAEGCVCSVPNNPKHRSLNNLKSYTLDKP